MAKEKDFWESWKDSYDVLYALAIEYCNLDLAEEINALLKLNRSDEIDKEELLNLITKCKELVECSKIAPSIDQLLEEGNYEHAAINTVTRLKEPYATQYRKKIMDICIETNDYEMMKRAQIIVRGAFNNREDKLNQEWLQTILDFHINNGYAIQAFIIANGHPFYRELTTDELKKIVAAATTPEKSKDLAFAKQSANFVEEYN